MMIAETNRDLSELKTLKVSLPTRLHLQLHSLKILSRKNISDTVEEALESYFDDGHQTQVGVDVELGIDPELT